MFDQVVPSSSSVAADNGALSGSAAVPHARWLRINVTGGGRMIVQVCFPSYAILSLGDLIPDDARVRIVADQIDFETVAAGAASRGCPAGELFTITSGDEAVRAWLD